LRLADSIEVSFCYIPITNILRRQAHCDRKRGPGWRRARCSMTTRKKNTNKKRRSATANQRGDDAYAQAAARSRALVEARVAALQGSNPHSGATRVKTLDRPMGTDQPVIVSGSWAPPRRQRRHGPAKSAKTWQMLYQLAVFAAFREPSLDFDRGFANKHFSKVAPEKRLYRLRQFRYEHKADIRAAIKELRESVRH
jgi:hypothetical protein